MTEIRIEDISGRTRAFRGPLEGFVARLDAELAYLMPDFGVDKILGSRHVLIAESPAEGIVGVYGSRPKFGMTEEFIVIASRFHGRGLGKAMIGHAAALPGRHLLLAVIDRQNAPSLQLFRARGYRKVGRRWDLEYLVKPVTPRGAALAWGVRLTFPLIRLLDRVRRAY